MKIFLILFDMSLLFIILYLIVTTLFQKGETDASVHTMIWTVFILSLINLLISFSIQIFIAYLMVKFSVPLPKRRDTVLKKNITLI
jgi:ABC-type sulfate transport system permease component